MGIWEATLMFHSQLECFYFPLFPSFPSLLKTTKKSKRAFILLAIKIIILHSLGAINLKIMFTCAEALSHFTSLSMKILSICTKNSGTEAAIVQIFVIVKPVVLILQGKCKHNLSSRQRLCCLLFPFFLRLIFQNFVLKFVFLQLLFWC